LGIGQVLANQQVIRLPARDCWQEGEYRIIDETGASPWRCQLEGRFAWLYKLRGLILHADRAWVQFIAHEDSLRSIRKL
jgi:hypothetical protein